MNQNETKIVCNEKIRIWIQNENLSLKFFFLIQKSQHCFFELFVCLVWTIIRSTTATIQK